jgi:hypothetical protein
MSAILSRYAQVSHLTEPLFGVHLETELKSKTNSSKTAMKRGRAENATKTGHP